MKKSKKETMRMVINLAENGIIIRNPDSIDPDNAYLAMSKATKNEPYGYTFDHSDEHRAIGRRIYAWLMEELSEEHECKMEINGFEIEINAWVTGREMNNE